MKKRKASILMMIFGLGVALFFGAQLIMFSNLSETLANSHIIEKKFIEAASIVDEFISINKRLHSKEEFASIRSDMLLNSSTESYPKEWGLQPEGSYYLVTWRGEWEEFYASWNRKSTLVFDENAYYSLNSRSLTLALTVFGSLIFILGLYSYKTTSLSFSN